MGVFKTLSKGIADLATLEVVTLSGKLEAIINAGNRDADGKKTGDLINWTQLIAEAGNNQGTVSLAAATKVQFDGDTTQFIQTNIPQSLSDAHDAAVTNANNVREGLVRMFSSALGLDSPNMD